MERFVNNLVVFEELGRVKVTSKENYNRVVRDASKVTTFNGTIDEAVDYIVKYMGGNNDDGNV